MLQNYIGQNFACWRSSSLYITSLGMSEIIWMILRAVHTIIDKN